MYFSYPLFCLAFDWQLGVATGCPEQRPVNFSCDTGINHMSEYMRDFSRVLSCLYVEFVEAFLRKSVNRNKFIPIIIGATIAFTVSRLRTRLN